MKYLYFYLFLIFPASSFAQTIGITSFATGFSDLVEITHAGDSRLFVAQQDGIIKILNANGTTNATPFLNISALTTNSGERGLLGLAFHPDYATNGFFYVNYTNLSGDTVIAKYTVNAINPNVANTTGTVLLTIDQPFANHNGGCLRFGPDGYLYISMGDGGGAGDTQNNGQNKTSLLGKLLRIDVDTETAYGIPADNPFVGTTGADEIWAYGLRNAWKFSFNRNNGDLWIADVGQGDVEEINKTDPTLPGLNYGWRCYEGSSPYNTTGCDASSTMTFPFAEYTHTGTGGCSITGGYVYTGSLYPNFLDKYFFADICVNKIGMVDNAGAISYSTSLSGGFYTTFGEDMNGELYLGSSNNGTIYKIIDTSQLSVEEMEKNNFYIYPNPAGSEVFIGSTTIQFPAKATVFDMTGKLLISQNIDSQQSAINTSGLNPGIYLINIEDPSGIQSSLKLSIK